MEKPRTDHAEPPNLRENTTRMLLAKYLHGKEPVPIVGLVEDDHVRPLARGEAALSRLLFANDPVAEVEAARAASKETVPLASVDLLPPIDFQEVWGAGVTYERSKVAREEESEQGASFYDKVYTAPRPELFFKATPHRVVGPGGAIRVRRDTKWCVPEPELALVISPSLRLVGFTIGDDVSARDIEGENPLYLPQAKLYDACCALGPFICLAPFMKPPRELEIGLRIERNGHVEFEGSTSVGRMARGFDELIRWLGIDNSFPTGVILLTGTGIVPPDAFSLEEGDRVTMSLTGVGELVNSVTRAR